MTLGEIGVLLGQRATAGFVGREQERAILAELSDVDGSTLLVHLHGIAGVGKSALLRTALADARAGGTTVVSLDCRSIEPTERGFTHALGAAVGAASDGIDEVAERVGDLGARVLLALDNYEVFRLMDAWLRQIFVPALGVNARVLVAGREPPLPAWFASPEWQGLFRSVPLGPLEPRHALAVLEGCGVGSEAAGRINRIARGHPLALRLASTALTERRDLGLEEAAMQRVVEEFTRLFLADVQDASTRRALEAASVVRRTTQPLLRAMLPDAAPQDAFDRLQSLPFVELSEDGLVLHDAVRQASAAALRGADPGRYRAYRRAAWRELRAEMSTAATPELWRHTADALYLIENPTVREGFFPSGPQVFAVEPASGADAEAIRAVCELQEPPGPAGLLGEWWAAHPEAFSVVRNRDGAIVGFYVMFDPSTVDRGLLRADPVTRAWSAHLRDHPAPRDSSVLFLRRWLGIEGGEGPSPIQAASWLDIKRTYMALRPRLRRVYTTVRDLPTFAPIVSRLRFAALEGATVELDGAVYHGAMLDFGPSSVDGWLAELIAEELGLENDVVVDAEAGELRLDDRRISLTRLELGVVDQLHRQEGRVVSRRVLLQEVWGSDYDGGSNIVDSVVRSLRKKLGDQASSIETVRGYGYRFRRT